MTLTDAQARILRAIREGADDHYAIGRAAEMEPARVNCIFNYPEREGYADPRMPAGYFVRIPSGHPLQVFSGSTYTLTPAGAEALARHEEGER